MKIFNMPLMSKYAIGSLLIGILGIFLIVSLICPLAVHADPADVSWPNCKISFVSDGKYGIVGAIVIDAGVASEGGKSHGDLADDVYDRDDLTLTPIKGGVGPLTVCALFDNVIRAARLKIPKN